MMKKMYMDLYKKGLLTADNLRDIVNYLPLMGLTPLDWEEITGESWSTTSGMKTE